MSFLSIENLDNLKPVTGVVIGTQIACINTDGSYVSIQPGGQEETRVIGQSYGGVVWTGPGAYELATPLGPIVPGVVIMYTGNGTEAFLRKYVP